MDNAKCDALLQRAYDAHLSEQHIVDTSGFDLCDEELNWLAKAEYVEIIKQWLHGGEYKITDKGIRFKSASTQ